MISAISLIIMAVGTILMIVSGIWAVIAAFSAGILWGLAYLFVPFAQLVFLFVHWGKIAKPFLLGVLGAMLLFGSGYFFARTADQRQIEQSIRFFQNMRRDGRQLQMAQILEAMLRSVQGSASRVSVGAGNVFLKPSGKPVQFYENLSAAVRSGRLAAVKDRLEAGDPVNGFSENGETPLMEAAAYGYGEIVRYLLENGADSSLKNKQGQTARDIAVENYRETIVAFLDQAQLSGSAPEPASAKS